MGNKALTRRGLLSLAAGGLAAGGSAAGPGPAAGSDPREARAASSPLTSRGVLPALYAADPLTGLALRGFDAVSYALDPVPAPGRPAFEAAWAGLVWRFAGPANQAAFARDPETYAPRLGGYDPLGVAEGRFVDPDPLVALRSEAGLYLFRSAGRRALCEPALLVAAEARWPAMRRLILP
ncbi:hypothetical protein [Methylobacterium oryzisoli]|uniref:hypothetical protein n=1 Tax=Methylobacterium oryzisoli TaxID=3385502 RepID=UPI0038914D4D